MYRGMLSIPYVRRNGKRESSVVSIRFRCLETHEHAGHGKYNTLPGDRGRLFNTSDVIDNDDTIAICEGETDTICAHYVGIPAVGVPGAQSWKPHFAEPFRGYETVWVLTDGDPPGKSFGDTVAKALPNAKIIPCPDGEDVSSFIVKYGAEALKERLV